MTSPRTYDTTQICWFVKECLVHLPNSVYALWSHGVVLFIVPYCIFQAPLFRHGVRCYVRYGSHPFVSGQIRLLNMFASCLYIRGCTSSNVHLLITVLASSILEGMVARNKNWIHSNHT